MSSSEYKAIFNQGVKLVEGRITLDGAPPLAKPGFFERLRLRKALAVFQKAATVEPTNGVPLLFLGKIEQRLGNNEKCIEWLNKANAVAPNQLTVMLELGGALARQGLLSESISVLVTAVRAYPNDPRAHFNIGLSLLMAGDANRAIGAFEQVLKMEPDVAVNRKPLSLAVAVSKGLKPVPRNEREIFGNI